MSVALRYHEATKYRPETIGEHPPLDWSRQPLPYKPYHGWRAVELAPLLPLDPNPFTGEAARPMEGWRGCTLAALARWLYATYGITGIIQQPGQPLYLRAAPSAGALYPTELYVAVRSWPELPAGLYGFDPLRHRLALLREDPGCADAVTAAAYGNAELAAAPLIVIVASVFERSRWRYRERAYRRVLLDAGHVIGNAGIAAAACGLRVAATAAFCDEQVEAAIGCPVGEEGVLALLAVQAVDGGRQRPAWTALPSPPREGEPTLAGLHHASALPAERPRLLGSDADELPLADSHGWASGPRLLGEGSSGPNPLALDPLRTIIRRRSCRRFVRASLARDALARILAATYVPERVGCDEQPAFARQSLATFIVVADVPGVSPGVYYLCPATLELRPVARREPREQVRFLCLGQDLGGDAAVTVFHTADLQRCVHRYGDRAYRYLHLDAGILGQRLNLAAVAEDAGASGIGGFFDDQAADLLGIPRSQAIVYITVLGVPAGSTIVI
ncbi:MAG: SagB/ThcOx family dehydrogenase [Planctomycetota bacterium]|nr:SagB/ThcOx family dehydrogenase [Planctomycetota bacterium]MCX8039182.1 SagB/ThcOx family dehydrogenase [Planctomycetota bacterium]MDW8373544.1 SagB/ThcOx family dehydrogenase [Planctomycetota bacterium]